jgi:hypothetical protein
MSENNKTSLRIRMYRQGLGDCFLLTFMRDGKDDFNMLIDCGLLQATSNSKAIMQAVAENIEATLQVRDGDGDEKKRWLDVVVLTHEHADHISGFSKDQAQSVFDRMDFGQVWASWMDNENHPKYKAVRERFRKQVAGLKAALKKMKSDEQTGLRETVEALVVEFFEEDVLGAKGSTNGRSAAWDYALKKSVNKPKFFSPGISFLLDGFDDVRIYILGPPEEFETFTKIDPPKDETYRSEESNFALADSFFAAVAEDDEFFDAELCQPFESHLRIDPAVAQKKGAFEDFFNTSYGFKPNKENEWRRIDDDWLAVAGGLALNLDNYTNNTCLAFAIELVKSKKVLLFPGDAQFGNWISWQKLSWEISDGNGRQEKVETKDLLKQTVFYKVGHHGSHNATLKKHGLEMMSNPDLVAMIPVDRDKAKSKKSKTNPHGWEMPESNLFERLKEKTRGRIILADEKDKTELRARCHDNKFIDKVDFLGSFVRSPKVSEEAEPLYIEYTIEG